MNIRFPSGETNTYDHAFSVIKGIIAAKFEIPVSNQLYFLRGGLLSQDLEHVNSNEIVDLVICYGNQYGICHPSLSSVLESLSIVPLATPQAMVTSRSVEDLNVSLRFHNIHHIFHKNPKRKEELEQRAKPYYDQFHLYRNKRHEYIRECRNRLSDNTIVISTFNEPYGLLFKNFMASCQAHNIDIHSRLLMFPMDNAANEVCQDFKVQTVYIPDSYGPVTNNHPVYGDRNFVNSMFVKNAVVQDVLDVGYNLLFMDIDMVWLKDPLTYLEHLANLMAYDYLFMFDGINPRFQPLYYNSGFFYVRNNEYARKAWDIIFNNYDKILEYRSQQVVVNITMNRLRELGLRTHRLDSNQFINGHQIVPGKTIQNPELNPQVVHASWTGTVNEKIRNLKAQGLWFLD